MTKRKRTDDQRLVAWGREHVRGLDTSAVFCGVMNNGPLDKERIEFTLHIGHALLTGKPIVLALPHHAPELSAKLRAVADHVVRYDPDDLGSLQRALVPVLNELGITPQ